MARGPSLQATIAVAASLLGIAATAHADRELCGRHARYRGAPVDLDVKGADIHDVYRLLADVGRINIVVSGDIRGKVTLALRRVPWDQIACVVAATHDLFVTIDRNVVLVRKRPAATARSAPPASRR